MSKVLKCPHVEGATPLHVFTGEDARPPSGYAEARELPIGLPIEHIGIAQTVESQ